MASTSGKIKEEPIELSSGDSEPEDHVEVEAEVEVPAGREVRPGRFPFNPGFNIDITRSQSSATQTLNVPAKFVRKWMSRKYSNVDLQTEDGKRYNVKLCWNATSRFTCAFGGEWYDLLADQNVQEGDNVTVFATKYCDTYAVTISRRRRH